MRYASLSLDLDNLWSYLKIRGERGWTGHPSYLGVVTPRILRFLSDRSLPTTFFLVGRDLLDNANRRAVERVAEAGHDFGNHSFSHEPWMHRYGEERIREEIADAHELIWLATGERCIGFRGPGYTSSPAIFGALAELGYGYDCSSLPTWIGPLARAIYFLSGAERGASSTLGAPSTNPASPAPEAPLGPPDARKDLFGHLRDGFRPLRPHTVSVAGRTLTEIPVTTVPGLRTPFHFSYLFWLLRYSEALATRYLRLALASCRAFGVSPSLLLHPLDFMGREDDARLAFFPAMDLPHRRKIEFLHRALDLIQQDFEVISLNRHYRLICDAPCASPAS